MMRPRLTIDDRLNAFCKDTDAYLEGAADGPLADLTFAAKDIFDVVGYVTGGGNPDWKATHEAAARTAWVVSVLVAAGATMVGKTITDEITRGIFGENAHYGTPLNPRAPGRVPGGSSSGSASAVAGGLVDFALGSDTGGSVRVPSSFCGLYGLRPTHGRIPLDGILVAGPELRYHWLVCTRRRPVCQGWVGVVTKRHSGGAPTFSRSSPKTPSKSPIRQCRKPCDQPSTASLRSSGTARQHALRQHNCATGQVSSRFCRVGRPGKPPGTGSIASIRDSVLRWLSATDLLAPSRTRKSRPPGSLGKPLSSA